MDFLQENGLYLLFVGVMMFMMFRNGGCCGGHSGQGHGGADAQTVDMVKDPVCGMHINPSTAIHE
jgi:Cu+-exporting ATPase